MHSGPFGRYEWLIVDSCVDQRTQTQPALAYLDAIGVQPESAVVSVLVTHWHTDHVRGISEVIRRCINAEFWMSQALNSDELLLASRRFGSDQASKHNALREFYSVMEMLQVRECGGTSAPSAGLAQHRTLLWRRGAGQGAPNCEVLALSPSNASVILALEALAEQFPDALESLDAEVSEQTPNDVAVAVAIQVGAGNVLLGSDLENVPPIDQGWKAVLADRVQPPGRAGAFKVAHHGSENALHDDVSTQMLVSRPWAVMTPFVEALPLFPESATSNGFAIARIALFDGGNTATEGCSASCR